MTTSIALKISNHRIVGILCALTFSLTFTLSQATVPAQLSKEQARHLLTRTGFAPRQAEVDAVTGQPANQAISDLIRKARMATPLHSAPGFTSKPSCAR